MTDQTPARPRLRPAIGLTVLFVLALAMGPGPGILLVNRPEPILGWPSVYLWGLVWYAVEVGVVVMAYLLLWRHDPEPNDDCPPGDLRSAERRSPG